MYDYGYGYGYDSYDYGSAASAVGVLAGVGVIMWIIGIAISVFSIICMWKLFTKAGKKGWASLVPIYNMIVMIEIAELPMWYIALFFVPFANIYAMFKIYIEIAHKFGKSTGFGVGMVFLSVIFIPMLAFGKAQYKVGVVAPVSANNNVNEVTNMQNNVGVNEQVNISNNNLQSNVMDINSGAGAQPMFDVNMQDNGNAFQPVGNINNNVTDMNVMEPTSVNNVNNMEVVNNEVSEVNMNNSVVSPVSDVTSVNEPIMNSPVNNMESVNNTVVQSMDNNIVSPVNSVPPVNETEASVQVNNVDPSVSQNNSMTKTCPNCGNQVDFSAMFCTSCGHNL